MRKLSNRTRQRRIIGYTCLKNEMHRYLPDFFEYYQDFLDDWFVLDDQSDDGSFELAQEYATTVRRPSDVPSFMEHEGKFRQYGWNKMTELLNPNKTNWIFYVDADEFLYEKHTTRALIERLEVMYDGLEVHIPDLHGVDEDGKLFQRTDGFWDQNRSVRFMKYRESGFKRGNRQAACGPPDYAIRIYRAYQDNLKLYHFGYIKDEDKEAKYARYAGADNFGHHGEHIESIIKEPEGFWIDHLRISDFLT